MGTSLLIVALTAGIASTPAQDRSKAAQVCIGIAPVKVTVAEGNAGDASSAVRELFESQLKDAGVRIEPIDAQLPIRAVEEAKQKNCDHVLYLTLDHKRDDGKSGGVIGSILGQTADAAAWSIPGGGSVGGEVARAAAGASVRAAVDCATSTKARDEVKLDYRLDAVAGGTRVGPDSERAKAKADGDDLLTPVVTKAATAITKAIATTRR